MSEGQRTSQLIRVDLGMAGVSYIEQQLANGMEMSSRMKDLIDLRSGTAFTWVPGVTTVAKLLDWNTGGVMSVSDRYRRAAEEVTKSCTGPGSVLIAEDATRRPEDKRATEGKGVHAYNGQIFCGVSAPYSLSSVVECLRTANSVWILNAAVFSYSVDGDWYDVLYNLGGPFADELVSSVELILVGAYDGEGFVYWKRQ